MSNMDGLTIGSLVREEEARECARFISESEPWKTLGRTYDVCLTMLLDPSREVFLARSGADIAGVIVIQMKGAFRGYIQAVCVKPEWRSRQVGRKLIGFAEERILAESPNVFLCVSSCNPRAQKLYTELGYERIGELKDYVVRGHSEILMRKTIGPLDEFEKNLRCLDARQSDPVACCTKKKRLFE